MANFDSNTTLSSPFIPGAALNIDNLGASGNFFGLGAGCDAKIDRLVIGVFADYDWFNDVSNTINLSAGGFGASTSVKLDNQWTVGGRLGAMVTPGTMAYVLAGYTNLETSDFSITTPFGNGVGAIGDFSGWVFGGGIEAQISGPLAMKIEYRYSDFDTKNVPISFSGVNVANMAMDTTEQTIRLGLVYRFGGRSSLRSCRNWRAREVTSRLMVAGANRSRSGGTGSTRASTGTRLDCFRPADCRRWAVLMSRSTTDGVDE